MDIEFRRVDWELRSPLRIAYQTHTRVPTVQVLLKEDGWVGRGEAIGVPYHGETVDSMLDALRSVRTVLRPGMDRDRLQSIMAPGGARNAVDCALWDLECKRTNRRAWDLAGVGAARPLTSAFTLSLDSAQAMARQAAQAAQRSLLKLKLGAAGDLERVAAVRRARPDAALIVDANQAWDISGLRDIAAPLAQYGVQLIEQPLPVGQDAALAGFDSPVPLCADESCQTVESLKALTAGYSCINIKLDKTGGLTEALRLAAAARAAGLDIMVGCMAGSSLSMAPAFVVAQHARFVDLDGPLLAKEDVADGINYQGSRMEIPSARLWG